MLKPKSLRNVKLSTVLALVGCTLLACSQAKPVSVHIRPTVYAVGDVVSELATPAVDEVVRQKPDKVIVYLCTNAAPAKFWQFNVELEARAKVQVFVNPTENGCA